MPTFVCPSVLLSSLLEETLVLILGPRVIQYMRSLQTLADERTLNPSGSLLPCVRQGNRYSEVLGIRTFGEEVSCLLHFQWLIRYILLFYRTWNTDGTGGRSEIGFKKTIKCLEIKVIHVPKKSHLQFQIVWDSRVRAKRSWWAKEIWEGAHHFLDLPASSPGTQEGTSDSKKLKIWGKGFSFLV